MKLSIRSFVGAYAFLFLATTVYGENLLTEGDGWMKLWKPAYGCITQKYDNKEVLKQSFPADFNKGNHAWTIQTPATVKVGGKYKFTIQYQSQDVSEAFAVIHFVGADGKQMEWQKYRQFSQKISGTQGQWTELVHEFTVPAGAASVSLGLRLNSPGTVWWYHPVLESVESSGN